MKKLIGVSLIAMLAVGPLTANARDLTDTELGHATIVTADATNVATTGYVKGAYSELGTVINTKQDKLSQGQLDAIGNVSGLTTRVGTLEGTVGDSESGLVHDVAANTSAIAGKQDTLTSAQQAAVDSGITSAKVSGYDAVESAVNNVSTGLATKASASDLTALTDRVSTAEDDIEALETAVGTIGDLDTTATDLVGAINEVKATADEALTSADLADYATKTGVVNTVNAATGSKTGVSLTVAGTPTGTISSSLSNGAFSGNVNIPTSGTVTTLTTWGSNNTGTADVTLATTSTPISGSVTADVSSTFTGTGINSGTATGDITGIDISVSGYNPS